MPRTVDHDLKLCTKQSRYDIYIWATNRKVSLYTNIFFCPGCNIYACIECHKLLHHEKDLLTMKNKLCCKFINKQKERKERCVPLSPASDVRAEMGRLSHEKKPNMFA